MVERVELTYDSFQENIESLQGHTDVVLEKERELIAAGYVRMFLPRVELLGPDEYVLRSFYGTPVKMIFWCTR